MTYRLEVTPSAKKALAALPKAARLRVDARINALATDPRPHGVKTLRGSKPPLLRLRVGDYRIIYAVEDDRLVVLVVRIAHRREVYR